MENTETEITIKPVNFNHETGVMQAETPAEQQEEKVEVEVEPQPDPKLIELEQRLAEREQEMDLLRRQAAKAQFIESPEKAKEIGQVLGTDYVNMPIQDLLFLKFKEDYPGLSENHFSAYIDKQYSGADFSIEENFGLDPFDYEKLKADAVGIRNKWTQKQDELKSQFENASIGNQQTTPEPTPEEIASFQKYLIDGIDAFKPQVELPQNVEVEFLKNDAAFREELKQAVLKPETYEPPYASLDNKGQLVFDPQKYAAARYNEHIVKNLPSILEQFKAKVLKDEGEKMQNVLQNKKDAGHGATISTGGVTIKAVNFRPPSNF